MTTELGLTPPDVSVLVALTNPAHVLHAEAHRWLAAWHLLNLAARHDARLVTFDRRPERSVLRADASYVLTLG